MAETDIYDLIVLAKVGLTEAKAPQQGLDFARREGDMPNFESVRRLRHRAAASRVSIERGSCRRLGAHVPGPGSDDIINLFALAIRLELGADKLEQRVSCYPSSGLNVAAMLAEPAKS